MSNSNILHNRRKKRIRLKLSQKTLHRPRLVVNRTNSHIYAQILDNEKPIVLFSASTLEKEIKSSVKNCGNVESAKKVGSLVAQRAIQGGIKAIVFDRSGYLYHGRIKALAEAARESGLDF